MVRFPSARRWAAGALAALTLSAAAPIAAAETAQPSMWRLSDANNTIWLFGSVHLLRGDVDWRRPELDAALEAADIVFFEADTQPAAQAALQQQLIATGFFTDGRSLGDLLNAERQAALADVAATMGAPVASLEAMRPWLAFLSIAQGLIVASGASAEAGVETVLSAEAQALGKDLAYFETLGEQLGFFAGLPEDVQLEVLRQTLDERELVTEEMARLVGNWASGNLEAVEDEILEEAPAAFVDVVYTQRNIAWTDALEALMAGDQDVLVVVGAGHLVGDGGLADLLRERGFDVERY